jgi:GT2 family glycosyltransferase
MLSILIRTYNDSVFEIVDEINQQCQKLSFNYEILISDDDPNGDKVNEEELMKFPNLKYWKNQSNLGRSNNLNKLIGASKFDYVLLLDNDVIPLRTNFIDIYLKKIKEECKVIYGGLSYENTPPETNQRLRWLYGHKKEAKSVHIRKEKFKFDVLVSNLVLKKSAFAQPIFDTELMTYGYEDLIFSEGLKRNRIYVCHLDNPVIHKGLETSKEFLNKTETALKNLIQLIKKGKLSKEVTPLSRAYFNLKSSRIEAIFRGCIGLFENSIKRNLVSDQPSLFRLNVYKLYFFSKYFQKND